MLQDGLFQTLLGVSRHGFLHEIGIFPPHACACTRSLVQLVDQQGAGGCHYGVLSYASLARPDQATTLGMDISWGVVKSAAATVG